MVDIGKGKMMEQFLQTLETAPESITFNATIAVIDAHYDFNRKPKNR